MCKVNGITDSLLTAAEKYAFEPALVANVCGVIGEMSDLPQPRTSLVLVRALIDHASEWSHFPKPNALETIVSGVCSILHRTLMHDEHFPALMEAGALNAFVGAAKAYPDDERIVKHVCASLAHLQKSPSELADAILMLESVLSRYATNVCCGACY